MSDVKPAPAGTMEIPGYILEVPGGWLTQDGRVTNVWHERGVWLTVAEAEAARDKATEA